MSIFGRGVRVLYRYAWPATAWSIHNLSIFAVIAAGLWMEQLSFAEAFFGLFPLQLLAIPVPQLEDKRAMTAL